MVRSSRVFFTHRMISHFLLFLIGGGVGSFATLLLTSQVVNPFVKTKIYATSGTALETREGPLSPFDRLNAQDIAPRDKGLGQPRELVAVLGRPPGKPYTSDVVLSPDETFIAYLVGLFNQIRIWAVTEQREVCRIQYPQTGSAGYSPFVKLAFASDSRSLFSVDTDKVVCQWDVRTGKKIREFSGPKGISTKVAFSPDRKKVVWSNARQFSVWDVARARETHRLTGRPDSSQEMAFSPDGRKVISGKLISAGDDYPLHVWDVKTGALLRRLTGHTFHLHCLAFSPDGKYVISGSADKTAMLWDLTSDASRPVRTIQHEDVVEAVVFAPDGKSVLTVARNYKPIQFWDVKTGKKLREIKTSSSVRSLAFTTDGQYLIVGNQDCSVYILRLNRER